jgi:xanthine dehydrogenase YagT iron-sulfur-binding subunit
MSESDGTTAGHGTIPVTLQINGVNHELQIEPRVSLLDALREYIGLSGTKKGCDQGACGACTVLADGERINSCLALAVQYQGREITTIEGVAHGDQLHALQAAFIEYDGFQCGYCTPGQICSAIGMFEEFEHGMPSAVTESLSALSIHFSEAEIKERMSGNLCRCGAYAGIIEAIRETFNKEAAR